MSIAQLHNVWMAYGAEPVLTGISWRIEPGDRIGLVGKNGCGKTSLFHLIAKRLVPDRGEVHLQKGIRVGYLAQDAVFEGETTVMGAALEGFRDLLDLRSRLGGLEARMASGESQPALLEEYGRLHHTYEHQGGYAVESRAKAILYGLGFREEDLCLQGSVLSGGQQNRLALAELLASGPDLLLLDEPTNHLDMQALEWLESFLSSFGGTFVVVSHDRFFLDHSVAKIVELEGGHLERYPGSYSAYAMEKEKRRGRQQKAYEAQRKHISRTEDYIRRNIAGQKTKQAQSRRKALTKLERLDQPLRSRHIRIRFSSGARGGDRVLQAQGLSKSYNGHRLFHDLDLTLWRGDRLGVVGPNGSGKSTLLRLLTGRAAADNGRISLGRGVQVGYYDQTRQDLCPDATVLDEVWSITPRATSGEVRSFLGLFLFSGDGVDQRIGTLSGGEQSRVALAKLMRSNANLLVLDEPTNHLDIVSRTVLEEALGRYDGTLLAASHDRYFLNRLFSQLLLIESGAWSLVDGNYTTLRERAVEAAPSPPAEALDKAARKAAYEENRRTQREKERLKRRGLELEQGISRLEAEVGRLDKEMAREDLADNWTELEMISLRRSKTQDELDLRFAQWESIEAKIAAARED